jgi:hypothetical protein
MVRERKLRMNLQDFNALEDAQAHSTTSSRMISPDMMLALLTKFGLINAIMQANTDEATALKLAFQFGSEFNLMNGHPASVKDMLDKMVLDGLATQYFVDYAVSYANPLLYPFLDATQQDFDNARLIGTQAQSSVKYDGNLSYIIRLKTDTLNIYVTRTTNLDVEQTIKIYAHEAPKDSVKTDSTSYIKQEHPIRTVTIPANSNGKAISIGTTTPTAVALQFSGESDKLIAFDMIVEVA